MYVPDELKRYADELEKSRAENESLKEEVQKLKTEMVDIKTVAAILEANTVDADEIKRKAQEELASIQHILKGRLGRFINVQRCGGLSMGIPQLKEPFEQGS